MSTHYRDTSFRQILGTTTIAFSGSPGARASVTVPDDENFASNPWPIYANGKMSIELDSTDRGGGILAMDPIVLQRSIMPHAYTFPLGAGVVWNTVPAAEIAPAVIAAIGAENIQQFDVAVKAGYVYRLFALEANITNAGDLWIAVTVPSVVNP